MTTTRAELVLVTGAAGFVAGHCVRELLEHGYAVRGTVRKLTDQGKTAHLRRLAAATGGRLELVEADLESDRGWAEAVTGCDYVMHVASPNPPELPEHEEDLIRPAVDGTLRVLRAAADSGTVRRVVLTSSIAAVISGYDRHDRTNRSEADWSIVDNCPPYQKSKTLAERAAWNFVAALPAGHQLELVTVLPGMVLGPLMRPEAVISLEAVRKLLKRDVPASPDMGFATVDVRDVATAHRLAMQVPHAAGNRYLCAGQHLWMRDIAKILAAEFNPLGYRVPTGKLPYWLMWLVARWDKAVRLALDYVGRTEYVSSAKAQRELGWTMRPASESIVDTGWTLIEHGLVPARQVRSAPSQPTTKAAR